MAADETVGMTSECHAVLTKASAAVGGDPVRYATEFQRDEASKVMVVARAVRGVAMLAEEVIAAAIRSGSTQLASAIPKSGWLIATDTHLCIHAKGVGGKIGQKKGHIPMGLVSGLTIDHLKKGKKKALVQFADDSQVELILSTKATAEAGEGWVKWLLGELPDPVEHSGDAENEAAPIFDMELLYEQGTISH